jgi:hypothetical protein
VLTLSWCPLLVVQMMADRGSLLPVDRADFIRLFKVRRSACPASSGLHRCHSAPNLT